MIDCVCLSDGPNIVLAELIFPPLQNMKVMMLDSAKISHAGKSRYSLSPHFPIGEKIQNLNEFTSAFLFLVSDIQR